MVSHGQYGADPWKQNIVGFPSNSEAHWIWSEDTKDNQNEWYFRGTFNHAFTKRIAGSNERVQDEIQFIPTKYNLFQNYPNPFNMETTIEYTIPEESNVRLAIFNTKGEFVRSLVDTQQNSGKYALVWNGLDEFGNEVTSGVYFYRFYAGNWKDVKKLMLVK